MGRPKGSKNKNTSKTKKPVKSSVPKAKHYEEQEKVFHRCCRCGKLCDRLLGNFPKVRSTMYSGNEGYLPWCNTCVNNLYEHYLEVFEDEEEAIKRTCLKLDLYYHPLVAKMTRGGSTSQPKMKNYISKANLAQVKGSSYDDTLDEEYELLIAAQQEEPEPEKPPEPEPEPEPIPVPEPEPEKEDSQEEEIVLVNTKSNKVKKKSIKLFGAGYEPQVYQMLQSYYDDLVEMGGGELDPIQSEYAKSMSLVKYQMQKSIQDGGGKDIHSLVNSYKSLLNESGIKKDPKANEACDPLGMVIADIEQYAPADYFADKKIYYDADGIKGYIDRFLRRPFKNLFSNSRAEPDQEFWIADDVDTGEFIEEAGQ